MHTYISWRLSLAVAVTLVAGLVVTAPPAVAAEVPEGATWHQTYLASQDGTQLRADVLLPADHEEGETHPVILSIGPYFGRNGLNTGIGENGPVDRFRDIWEGGNIFERGYAWVQVDSRGFGGSQGCNDFGGSGEQMDTEAAVNWAASQPWSNGNVGMWGKSYDAWTQVMALAENPVGLKAAVIQAPLIEAYRGMFLNGVHYTAGWYATPSLYAGYDLAPTTAGDSRAEELLYPAAGTATNPACYAENIGFTTQPDHSLAYWQERDIIADAGKSDVPVLWSHGFNDANTKPDNFMPVWSQLDGFHRGWFGQWAHDRANLPDVVGRDGFIAEAMDLFDHELKDEPRVEHPDVEVQDGEGVWRTEDQWPPADASDHTLPLLDGTYTDEDGYSAGSASSAGTWTFTPPAPYDLRFAGNPTLTLTADTQVPNANLITLLYDVGPSGQARLITRGAHLLDGGQLSFDTYPQDWILREGHRLGVLLVGDDGSWFFPTHTNTEVSVTEASLDIPFLTYQRDPNLEGEPADAMESVPVRPVDQQTIEERTVDWTFPPAPQPRPDDAPGNSGEHRADGDQSGGATVPALGGG